MKDNNKVAVIGLGLIGGSMAKAIRENTSCVIYGYDIDETTARRAKLTGAIDHILTDEVLPQCSLVITALYPQDTIDYVTSKSDSFGSDITVMDCCGVKKVICDSLFPLAEKKDFTFIGGHPMAGIEHSGFNYSLDSLFYGASMVLVPAPGAPIEKTEAVKKLCSAIGFTNIQITTPEEHDKMIAFTSQLAHVVSSAYIKSPTAKKHQGFSAGSYKDLTRVAKLNETMWTELFLDNPDNLITEIDNIIDQLILYRDAINEDKAPRLKELLKEGRECKARIDGEIF